MLTKIKTKTPLATFALAVAIVVALAFAAGYHFVFLQIYTLASQRSTTWHTRLKLTQTLSLITDIETGGRGFALTGEEDFLEHYTAARHNLPSLYQELKEQARKANCNFEPWEELDALIAQRLELSGQVVEQRRLRGKAILDDLSPVEIGKQTMDSIRLRIGHIDAELEQLLASRWADLLRVRQLATWFNWLSMLSIVALIASAGYLLWLERAAKRLLEEGLRDANLNLEQQVVKRTAALTEAKSRLAAFTVEQQHLIEVERKRLSREVHDQVGATFAGLKMILRGLPDASIPADQLQALLMAVDMGVVTARRIATSLRPPLLDDLGLQAALEQLLDNLSRGDGPLGAVDLHDQDRLTQDQAIGLYRIVQEAVSNVVRHAHARHFVVRGGINGGGCYRLTMLDDGIGLGVVEPRQGALGLAGMRERAELMGGSITIENGPEGGVLITLVLPLEPGMNNNDHENTAA